MNKKLMVLMLAGILALGMTGCKKDNPEVAATNTESSEVAELEPEEIPIEELAVNEDGLLVDEAGNVVTDDEGSPLTLERAKEKGINNVSVSGGLASNGTNVNTGGATGSKNDANGNSGTNSSGSNAGKTWYDAEYKTERVWVVTQAASSYQEPIYGQEAYKKCNNCGADVTEDAASHGKMHALNGEGGGHHTAYRQVITGYNTVNVPEEGYWQEKKVLVRAAGWY